MKTKHLSLADATPPTNYQPPVIVQIQSAYHSKIGMEAAESMRLRHSIDGVDLNTLVGKYGSPLFVFSEVAIRAKYRRAYEAFTKLYPDTQFAWSYKTNYLKAICLLLHAEGAFAEVVSYFEYERARDLGIPGKQILYNGPCKSPESLERAILDGAHIHIDHLNEIDQLEQIATRLNRKVAVGIRVNLDCGVQPQWTRFGFNLESGQVMDAVKRIQMGKVLQLSGLHTHIGTFIMDVSFYGAAIKKLCDLFCQIENDYEITLSYLDIGGGFASLSQLIGVYQPPDVSVPPIEAYAKAICDPIKRAFSGRSTPPKLYVEAGRHVVDEAGYLITTVQSRKLLPNGMRAYTLDAGVNILYTSRWYRYQFEVDRELKGPTEPVVLYGPLCMNIDVVCEYITLPSLPLGTRLTLSPVGAYNVTQSMQFIQYRPAIVLIGSDKRVELLKERESLEVMNQGERVPEFLRPTKKAA